MTGVLVRTGVVTACCGGHHPAPGEASTCLCCAECITNVDVQARPVEVRAEQARADRARLAAWWPTARHAARRAQQLLVHGAIDDLVRPLAAAVRHAVALPPQDERPDLPELDEACRLHQQRCAAEQDAARVRQRLHDELLVGFTGVVPV